MKRPASLTAGIFLVFLATLQALRFLLGINVVAAGIEIPVWPSAAAAVFLALLAVWLLKERNS